MKEKRTQQKAKKKLSSSAKAKGSSLSGSTKTYPKLKPNHQMTGPENITYNGKEIKSPINLIES